MPPLDADERDTLEGWLHFHAPILEPKCRDLDGGQAREASVPPSELTLLGLVQHMAEVERNWFHRVLTGESVPAIHCPGADPEGPNSGFELAEGAKLADALAAWQAEILQARANWKGRELGATSAFMAAEVTLRWICIEIIGGYARHAGHADLLRECIDGRTGV